MEDSSQTVMSVGEHGQEWRRKGVENKLTSKEVTEI
jgi:hypothetical protein